MHCISMMNFLIKIRSFFPILPLSSGLLNKKTLRENVKDYVNGSKMMIHLEEEAQAHYLKRFDQNDIKIVFHMDRQYYFPVTVCHLVRIVVNKITLLSY